MCPCKSPSARTTRKILTQPSVMCWGLIIQRGTFAVFMPIHLAIHLSTSPTVSSRKAKDFAVRIPSLLSIPISLAIGFIVPAVALALPAPSILTYDQKQNWIAAWQVFPIWVEVLQETFSFLFAKLSSSRPQSSQPSRDLDIQTIKALRMVYIFVLIIAGITRITTLSLSLTSVLFPSIFTPEHRGVLNPSNVFQPASISPSKMMASVGEGAAQLLLYDEVCGSAALLVWSIALLVTKYSETRPLCLATTAKILASSAVLVPLFGPCGCAVAFTWARDELVFEEGKARDKRYN